MDQKRLRRTPPILNTSSLRPKVVLPKTYVNCSVQPRPTQQSDSEPRPFAFLMPMSKCVSWARPPTQPALGASVVPVPRPSQAPHIKAQQRAPAPVFNTPGYYWPQHVAKPRRMPCSQTSQAMPDEELDDEAWEGRVQRRRAGEIDDEARAARVRAGPKLPAEPPVSNLYATVVDARAAADVRAAATQCLEHEARLRRRCLAKLDVEARAARVCAGQKPRAEPPGSNPFATAVDARATADVRAAATQHLDKGPAPRLPGPSVYS
jgi:hypothetical protein